MRYVIDNGKDGLTVSVHDGNLELVRVPVKDKTEGNKLVRHAVRDGLDELIALAEASAPSGKGEKGKK